MVSEKRSEKALVLLLMAAFCLFALLLSVERHGRQASYLVMGILLVLVYFQGYRFSAERAYNEQKIFFH